jgi:hypothetical protein
LANRAGDAPIKAPRTLQSDHLAFTLPGSLWLQLVDGLASTPSVGSYLADTPREPHATATNAYRVVACSFVVEHSIL